MEIGVGLDGSLRLSYDDQAELSRQAAKLGYTSIWTNDTGGEDAFQTCALRWEASREVVPGGLWTGIAVSAVGPRSPLGFAISGGTLSRRSGGRFILGIGTGGAYTPQYRNMYGIRQTSSLRLMRDYVGAVRGLVNGETVTVESKSFTYRAVRLGVDPPPRTPVYLGALGPEMCRLGAEIADGLALNWCSAEFVHWSRQRADEGAARAGRDPAACKLAEHIRVCVDEDVPTARRAYTRAVMGYALGRGTDARGRPQGYRAHFERMGFAEQLTAVDRMREKGAQPEEVVDSFPEDVLKAVGYYGTAAGAAKAFARLAEGLDTAIVRVVAARPGVDSVRAVMDACAPGPAGG